MNDVGVGAFVCMRLQVCLCVVGDCGCVGVMSGCGVCECVCVYVRDDRWWRWCGVKMMHNIFGVYERVHVCWCVCASAGGCTNGDVEGEWW